VITWQQMRALLWCLTILCCASSGRAQYPPADFSKNPFLLGVPVDLAVPAQPVLFQGTDQKFHLAYELHITNFSKAEILLKQVEVIDDSSGAVLASYSGKELRDRLRSLVGRAASQSLSGGMGAVVFIWLDFTNDDVPKTFRHRLRVATPALTRDKAQAIEGGHTRVAGEARVIGPPLRGGDWWAANGPSNHSGHRRTLIAVDGKARIPERYATDWSKLQNGELVKGDPSKNSSYFSYGAEVLAVADGTVVSVLDGLPENRPEGQTYPVPLTLKNMGGNNLIVDIGQQQFAFYAHLQPHTIRVKVGDHVNRGQLLALAGNSGNATGPHLHFQLSDANSELGTEGLPFVIDSLEMVGRVSGEDFKLRSHPEPLYRVLPLEDDVVRFP
jgi:murein DD-endopeptidase